MNVTSIFKPRIHQLGLALALLSLVSADRLPAQDAPPRPRMPVEHAPIPRDPTVASAQLAELINTPHVAGDAGRVLRIDLAEGTTTNPPARRLVAYAEFSKVSFAEASRKLSEITGINIAPSKAAGDVPVNTYLKNLEAQVLLETLCNVNGLWFRWEPKSEVLRVYTVAEFRQDLASLREEKTEVFTLLYPNTYGIAHALQDLFGERVRVSFGSDELELNDDLQQRFDRFDLVDQRSQGFGALGGSGTSGGVVGGQNQGSGYGYGQQSRSSLGQQTRQNLPAPTGPSAQLSAEQIQTLQAETGDKTARNSGEPDAAAKIVGRRVNIYVSVLRRQNKLVVRTADEDALTEIRKTITLLDVPTSLVLLEVKVLSVNLGDGFNSSLDYQFNGVASTKGGAALTTAGFTTGEILPPASGSMTPGGSGLNSGDMTFQVVNEYFRARLQLLETKTRVTQLATPFLLTANNEVSRVFIGEERPINRGFTSGQVIASGNNTFNTGAGTDIQFVPIGTTLLITPNINADRTVTLRILQENSSINVQGGTILVPAGTGFQQQAVDIVQSRTVSGTFVAKDRMTVAVSGLISEEIHNNSSGIPFLSRIPLLGQLFRRDDKLRTRSELLVIIRPYVMNTPTEAEAVSQTLLKELSIHPTASTLSGTLDTFKTNQVPLPADSYPLSTPK